MNYSDNPLSNKDYLRSLSDEQLHFYVKGYIMACVNIRECYTDLRTLLLGTRLECPAGSYKARLLDSHIRLLDNLELMIEQKEGNLKVLFPENVGQ